MRTAKAQASLCIRAVLPELSLFAHTKYREVEEASDNEPEIWPHWVVAHALLKEHKQHNGEVPFLMRWYKSIFQELLSDDVTQNRNLPQSNSLNNSPPSPDNSSSTELSDMYKDIVGTKCRAPYTHEWGSMGYHNALIIGIDELTDLDLPKVNK